MPDRTSVVGPVAIVWFPFELPRVLPWTCALRCGALRPSGPPTAPASPPSVDPCADSLDAPLLGRGAVGRDTLVLSVPPAPGWGCTVAHLFEGAVPGRRLRSGTCPTGGLPGSPRPIPGLSAAPALPDGDGVPRPTLL